MKTGQQALLCGIAVCVVVGIVGGNYWVLSRFEARLFRTADGRSAQSVGDLGPLADFPPYPQVRRNAGETTADDGQTLPSHYYLEDDVQYFPSGPAFSPEPPVQTLKGEDEPQAAEIESGHGGLTPPEKLSAPENASPIPGSPPRLPGESALNAARRAVIAEELPESSPEERAIWLEQLQGLPPEAIRDILRIRRHAPDLNAARPKPAPQPSLENLVPPPSGGLVHDLLLRRDSDGPQELDAPRPNNLCPLPIEPDRTAELPPSWLPSWLPGGEIASRPSLPGLDRFTLERLEPTLAAIEQARDVVLNNIANAHTIGFKRTRVVLEDLPYMHMEATGSQDPHTRPAAIGLGVRVAGTQTEPTQGKLFKTRRALDVAIVGDGYFQIEDGDQVVYTRAGVLTLTDGGNLAVLSSGRPRTLTPTISIPSTAIRIAILPDGSVAVTEAGKPETKSVGQIELARFANAAGLQPLGENLFAATAASGQATAGFPQTAGLGRLRQGFLECSNVDIDQEIAELRQLRTQLHALEQVHDLILGQSRLLQHRQRLLEEPPLADGTPASEIPRQSLQREPSPR